MMHLPCASCAQPRPIAALHAWVEGDPFCSASCLESVDTTRPSASRSETLGLAIRSIDRALGLLPRVADAARRADDALLDPSPAPFLVGLVFGTLAGHLARAAVDDQAQRSIDREQDLVWTLDQELVTLARHFMTLHALGYPIAPAMQPLVIQLVPVSASRPHLVALHRELTRLRAGVQVWLDEL